MQAGSLLLLIVLLLAIFPANIFPAFLIGLILILYLFSALLTDVTVKGITTGRKTKALVKRQVTYLQNSEVKYPKNMGNLYQNVVSESIEALHGKDWSHKSHVPEPDRKVFPNKEIDWLPSALKSFGEEAMKLFK